ncbi:unnamed protein product [Oikopleura dioica]|uniref:Uncharacterized protein n=1 Tax=Oikopleura dioica TaxID=34765 RepID=E4XTM5_OIKDI|nr:unnamed protein product [Oikopleura dioica]
MVVSGDLDRLTVRLKNLQDKFHRFQSTNRLEISDLKKAVERTRNEDGRTSNEEFQGSQGGSSSVRRLSNTVKNLSNMQKKIVGGFNEVLTRFNKQQEFLKAGFDRIGELENSCCSVSDSERYRLCSIFLSSTAFSDYTEYDSPSSSSSN